MNDTNNTGKLVGLGAIVLALAVLGYITLDRGAPAPDATVPVGEADALPPEAQPVSSEPATPPTSTRKYKDGTYTATGGYTSPGGGETIAVTLVLKDDVIMDATVKSNAVNPTSKQMQAQFISGFKAQVVGKSLDEVTLSKVSGSSLTPGGWNDAVTKIKAEARA